MAVGLIKETMQAAQDLLIESCRQEELGNYRAALDLRERGACDLAVAQDWLRHLELLKEVEITK